MTKPKTVVVALKRASAMTDGELARALDVTERTVFRWRTGAMEPRPKHMRAIWALATRYAVRP